MTTFFAYLTRLIVIMVALALAAIAASVFFVGVGILPFGDGIGGSDAEAFWNFAGGLLLIIVAVAAFSSTLLLLPAFAFVIASEYFGWNGLLFHGVSGALLGASVSGISYLNRTAAGEGHLVLVGAAAGIIGAGVYWLVAGRNAGKLFEKIAAYRSA